MENDAIKLRQYLLGSLQEKEAEELDLQIIGSKSLEEELYLAEDALIEDYLDETLSTAEIELFHKNFLISEARNDQLRELAALKNYAQNIVQKEVSGKPADNFFQNLKNAFALNFRPAAIALGLLLIGILAVGIWQFGLSGSTDEIALLEKEAAALNGQDLSDLRKYENFSKLSLFSGLLRSSDSAPKLSADGLSGIILIRLALPPEENSNVFNAKIIRNQKDTISLNKMPVYSNQSGKEIRLLLPSSFLKRGEYKVELLPVNRKDFPVNYSFTVQ
jgi:hypothetical protein